MLPRQHFHYLLTAVLLIVCITPVACQSRPKAAQEGYVGVVIGAMPPEFAARYGVHGPAIGAAGVIPDGPAYKSGLRQGDLITSIDGQPVSDPNRAFALLRGRKVGDKVRLGLVHLQDNGQRFSVEIGIMVEAKPAGYGTAQGGPPPASGGQSGTSRSGRDAGGLRFVSENVPRGFPKQAGYCKAFAPQDWVMRSRPYGDTADLDGANGMAHASWGMLPINMAMRAYYGDMYGPPEVATLALASSVSHSPARWTGSAQLVGGFFTAQNFETNSTIGTVLYHAFPGSAPGQYVLGSYLSWVDKRAAKLLPTAQAVMVSIQCQTHLRPSEPTGALPRPGDRKSHGENDSLKDYNAQLGTQWAHSNSTGEHYLLDYASQWNDNGPDGPGYYRKTGSNSYEKLETGW